jgi:hypothetical protein
MLRVLTTGPGTAALTGEMDRDQLLLGTGNSKKIHTIMFSIQLISGNKYYRTSQRRNILMSIIQCYIDGAILKAF